MNSVFLACSHSSSLSKAIIRSCADFGILKFYKENFIKVIYRDFIKELVKEIYEGN